MNERNEYCNTIEGQIELGTFRVSTSKAGDFLVEIRHPQRELNITPDPSKPCLIFKSIAELARDKDSLALPLVSGQCARCATYMFLNITRAPQEVK